MNRKGGADGICITMMLISIDKERNVMWSVHIYVCPWRASTNRKNKWKQEQQKLGKLSAKREKRMDGQRQMYCWVPCSHTWTRTNIPCEVCISEKDRDKRETERGGCWMKPGYKWNIAVMFICYFLTVLLSFWLFIVVEVRLHPPYKYYVPDYIHIWDGWANRTRWLL